MPIATGIRPDRLAAALQYLEDVANRGVIGGALGAPVDMITTALRPFGYETEKPVMGSEWIGDKMQQAGMVSENRHPIAETVAGFIDPLTATTGGAKPRPPHSPPPIPVLTVSGAPGAKANS